MPKALAYHRPTTLEEAVELLADPTRVALAGGTVVNIPGGEPVEVVDLQAVGLSGIEVEDGRVRCGATTSLQELADGPVPDLIALAARRELPSAVRRQGTIGGVVATGHWESVMLGALLVSAAEVVIRGRDGEETLALPAVLASGLPSGSLITAVDFSGEGQGIIEAVGRTPRDTPIVAAIARRHGDTVFVALTGVAATPVLVDPGQIADLDPAGDFRGSAEYRKHLAGVLVTRVTGALS